jgi:hypothetical protein
MRIHPRTRMVDQARRDLEGKFYDLWQELDLTSVEALSIAAPLVQLPIKYMLRTERHPDDPDKGADEV